MAAKLLAFLIAFSLLSGASFGQGHVMYVDNEATITDVTEAIDDSTTQALTEALAAAQGEIADSLNTNSYGWMPQSAYADSANNPRSDVDINGGAIDGTPVGANSASTGAFTTITGTSFNAIPLLVNGTDTNFLGINAGSSNTGTYSNGFGYDALRYNTGISSNGFGFDALQNNTGDYSNGFGYDALRNNTGDYSNGFGFAALRNNTGTNSNGFGHYALQYNIGTNSNGFGGYALYNNTGTNSNGFGTSALYNNTGDYNTALGSDSFNTFNENTGGNKTFDYTNVNPTGVDTLTITGHGFGSNDTYVNLKYTEGTSPITGITDGAINQFKIVDANTLCGRTTVINATGSGTGHTMTPQYTYTNSTAIGYNAEPDASNQIVLGNANVTEVKTAGGIKTLGNIAFGDTAVATTDRYLYFGTDGSVDTEYLKWDETGTKFVFSDSLSALGYIDASDVFEGDAVNAILAIKGESDAITRADGFKELDHSTLPKGVRTKIFKKIYRDKETGELMPEGFIPSNLYRDKETGILETEGFAPPDSLQSNYTIEEATRYDIVITETEGRNLSQLVSILVSAFQAQQIQINDLIKRVKVLEAKKR